MRITNGKGRQPVSFRAVAGWASILSLIMQSNNGSITTARQLAQAPSK